MSFFGYYFLLELLPSKSSSQIKELLLCYLKAFFNFSFKASSFLSVCFLSYFQYISLFV